MFDFPRGELAATVWKISKVDDADRHQLAKEWKLLAVPFDPEQCHVSRNGLVLLVAYVLHMIDVRHAVIPN